jgi:two-component system nitrate/nitrite response regulator NarL
VAPATRVLILSAVADAEAIATAVDLGASGYVCKDVGVSDIIRAVERVHDGETVLGPKVARTLARRTETDPDDIQWLVAFLTRREREVLRRIVMGQGTSEMAKGMGISRSTARTHVQNVLQKLGVHSRLQAVAAVSRAGADPAWITAPSPRLRHVK